MISDKILSTFGPRSGTEKGAPTSFLPLAFAGVWVVANLVLGKTHYPDIITRTWTFGCINPSYRKYLVVLL